MTANAELLTRRSNAVPRGVATATPVFAARALNAELWDVEGHRYVDFAGGIAVLNVGHRNPRVMAAVAAQLECYTHTAFQVIAYEPYIELAEKLNALAPFSGPAKTIFFCTGGEAVENAVKVARAATGRSGVIAFTGGFHGRTALTMALTGKVAPYKRMFGQMPGAIYHVPFPVTQYGVTVEDSLKALKFLCKADIEPTQIAAIIVEPVQGEGGFHVAPSDFLKALRSFCDQHGIVFIADEIQSGFGRTGKMFAIEHSGVEPDLVTVAKSLGGGLPISGVIGRAALMDAPEPGGLGGTYGGPPLACAAGLAVLDEIAEEKLLERSAAIGETLKSKLANLATRNDLVRIANIRGLGAMIGFDILDANGEPDGATAKRTTVRALENGLIVLSCGVYGETIRLLVPLTAEDTIVDDGLNILEKALAA
jgi:4-aminobutyrate aminotransferase/(S)-3-amino-2-methylpropionate transaminase